MRVLVVTAVAAEAAAVTGAGADTAPGPVLPGGYALTRTPAYDVLVGGVGPAAAAAATATALAVADAAGEPYGLVVSAGIGGGFPPHAPVGSVVVSDSVVAADLGAETPDGYLPVDALGFGRTVHPSPAGLSALLAEALGAVHAPVLTVSTVTGSAARAAELTARHPRAAAEAMEGFGVAEAAAAHGLPVVEIRAVSNAVGPRDRAAWRIGDAMAALRQAFHQLVPVLQEQP
ncbi:futalosine hydrolase [Streptomyces peucetius]|uniref:Futalosine hydrolase n=1 Tax=Streptomyces peucetius TaxID=1950 RepID=A0ABY6I789_STRPE|nr:futalosine hydrolase [Streptomyces peucetius]UYQ62866.1 futalosine hydrolase [Streptomyces peucetius]